MGNQAAEATGVSVARRRTEFRRAWLGVSVTSLSTAPVIGESAPFFLESHRSIERRSYEWPSASETGSLITSCEIGQENEAGRSSPAGMAPAWPGSSIGSRNSYGRYRIVSIKRVGPRTATPILSGSSSKRSTRVDPSGSYSAVESCAKRSTIVP